MTEKRGIKLPYLHGPALGSIALLRLQPFDTATAQGRSQERHRRVALSFGGALASKLVSAVAGLVTVPLTLSYLGTERYGLWMTISSAIVLMGFADLGMGNGLLNNIAAAHGRDDRNGAQRYVASAFFILTAIALIIVVAFVIIYPLVDWARVFNVKSPVARAEAGLTAAVLIVFLCVNMPLDTVQRVQQGYQEGFISSLWGIAGSVLSLLGLLVVISLRGGLPWLVAAMSGGPALALAMNWASVFLSSRRWLLPKFAHFHWATARELATSGALFLLLGVFALAASSSDNIIIAHEIGPDAVAGYAVTQKIFITVMLSQYFVAPLWPAFGEALARSDFAWARQTLVRALGISVAVAAATAMPLLAFGQPLIRWWVGPEVTPTLVLLAGFSAWLLIGSYAGAMSSFLNTKELLRRQVWFYGLAAFSAVLLKVLMVRVWGTPGVIWAGALAFAVFYVVPATRLAFGYLSRASFAGSATGAVS